MERETKPLKIAEGVTILQAYNRMTGRPGRGSYGKGVRRPRNCGPCEQCGEPTKTKAAVLCPDCRRRAQAVVDQRNLRARRRAMQEQRETEEERLYAMVEAPLPKTRVKAYDDVAVAVASNEQAAPMSRETAAFWRKWYENPDNLCTTEALDAAGWGVTTSGILPSEELDV